VRILLVDDDPDIVDALSVCIRFQRRDAHVLGADNGQQALELFYDHPPDMVVLDVTMPRLNGFEVLARIRRVSEVPVLLLTGRAAEEDQVHGLEMGADEYVTKPFSHLVLLARIHALLRRARSAAPDLTVADFSIGPLAIDAERRRVRLDGRPVELTPAEYRLLYHLARNPGHVLGRDALLALVWGDAAAVSSTNLKALVSRLRAKIEPDGSPTLIENVRGMGYRLTSRRDSAQTSPVGTRSVAAGAAVN
jgi:DNA-binding response OmpR family regulator